MYACMYVQCMLRKSLTDSESVSDLQVIHVSVNKDLSRPVGMCCYVHHGIECM